MLCPPQTCPRFPNLPKVGTLRASDSKPRRPTCEAHTQGHPSIAGIVIQGLLVAVIAEPILTKSPFLGYHKVCRAHLSNHVGRQLRDVRQGLNELAVQDEGEVGEHKELDEGAADGFRGELEANVFAVWDFVGHLCGLGEGCDEVIVGNPGIHSGGLVHLDDLYLLDDECVQPVDDLEAKACHTARESLPSCRRRCRPGWG